MKLEKAVKELSKYYSISGTDVKVAGVFYNREPLIYIMPCTKDKKLDGIACTSGNKKIRLIEALPDHVTFRLGKNKYKIYYSDID